MDFQTHIHLGAAHNNELGVTANPGIGLLVREADMLGGLGVWRNSLKETAPYGFIGWQPIKAGGARLGGIIGATKYKGDAKPVGGLLLTYKLGGSDWHFLVTPKVKNYAPATIHLSTSF